MMEFTAEMIAGFLGGDIVGDKQATVHTVSSIEEGKAGSLAYLTNPKYEPFLYTTQASIVLVSRWFTPGSAKRWKKRSRKWKNATSTSAKTC